MTGINPFNVGNFNRREPGKNTYIVRRKVKLNVTMEIDQEVDAYTRKDALEKAQSPTQNNHIRNVTEDIIDDIYMNELPGNLLFYNTQGKSTSVSKGHIVEEIPAGEY